MVRTRRRRSGFRAILALLLAGVGLVPATHTADAAPAQQPTTYQNPLVDGSTANPSILKVGSTYYAYVSGFDFFTAALNVPAFSSPDLVNWSQLSPLDVLPASAAGGWVDTSSGRNFSSPSVHHIPSNPPSSRFVLYFSARHQTSGITCIGVAAADSPAGPFQGAAQPLICPDGGAQDPSLAAAGTDVPQLVYRRNGSDPGIYNQPLTPDGQAIDPSWPDPIQLYTAPSTWWQEGNVDRPALAVGPDGVYLLFAGGVAGTDGRAIGWSQCDVYIVLVLSCAQQTSQEPWIAGHDAVASPGGPQVFSDGTHQWIAYDALPGGSCSGGTCAGTRNMRIDKLCFAGDQPRTNAPTSSPQALDRDPDCSADVPGQSTPRTDPANDAGWVLQDELSDEFDGTTIDTTKWHNGWNTWSRHWRWSGSASQVSDGSLRIAMSHDPSDQVDPSPNGWSHGPRGFSSQASYVTTLQRRSGQSALVHYHRVPYAIATKADVRNLQNGRYSLRAWVSSSGGQHVAEMAASLFGSGQTLSTPISQSSGYSLYEIPNIDVTNGQVRLELYSDAPAGRWLRIDDVELVREGTTTNLAPNPGFESRDTIPYSSGIVRSRGRILHGYLEARIKGTDVDYGVAPAFWLAYQEPAAWTEIDIVELQQRREYNDRDVGHSRHIWRHPNHDGDEPIPDPFRWQAPRPVNDGFHVYGLEWDESEIRWYVDGELQRTAPTEPYFDQALQVIISQGLREPYTSSPTPEGFPSTMEVDYVRVWS